ncbi:TPA: hypothetical protein MJA52_003924 [Klebsiella aerogenes]|nr:hypothetical protein [Klebsiella aerogenes]
MQSIEVITVEQKLGLATTGKKWVFRNLGRSHSRSNNRTSAASTSSEEFYIITPSAGKYQSTAASYSGLGCASLELRLI